MHIPGSSTDPSGYRHFNPGTHSLGLTE